MKTKVKKNMVIMLVIAILFIIGVFLGKNDVYASSLDVNVKKYQVVIKDGVNYITKIEPNNQISEVLKNIETNGTFSYSCENGIAYTGMKLDITLNGSKEEYILVVTGDTNGNGIFDVPDRLALEKHILNKKQLTGAYFLAGDVNEDNQISISDQLRIEKYITGRINEL